MSVSQPSPCELLDGIKEVNEVDRINFIKRERLHMWKNNLNESLLHFVAKSGDIEMIKLLIQAEANVNAQNSLGKTPIMLVIEHKPYNFFKIIKVLYEAGADINTVFNCGKSAVQLALEISDSNYEYVHSVFLHIIYHCECMSDSSLTAKYLKDLDYPIWRAVLLSNELVIEHMILGGSPVNSRHPIEKFTALLKAVQNNELEIIKVLVKYNADVDLRDQYGFLPIMYYGDLYRDDEQQPEIIKILMKKSILLKNLRKYNRIYQLTGAFENGSKEVIKILLEHYNDDILNIRDSDGQTPLHYLSSNYQSGISELLQNKEIDANLRDSQGRTPIFIAARSAHTNINILKFLLEKDADVNVVTTQPGVEVPLFALCKNDSINKETYFEIMRLFLQYDLNIQFIGPYQNTVFDIIIQNKKFYMAEPLLAHLAILDELKKPILEHIRTKINSHRLLKNYFSASKIELEKMKNFIINDRFTLHMVVVNDDPKMNEKLILNSCRFSSDSLLKLKKLNNTFNSDNFYYNSLVRQYISSIAIRLELLQEVAPTMCEIFKFKIDPCHLVLAKITDYLNNEDLENLIKIQI